MVAVKHNVNTEHQTSSLLLQQVLAAALSRTRNQLATYSVAGLTLVPGTVLGPDISLAASHLSEPQLQFNENLASFNIQSVVNGNMICKQNNNGFHDYATPMKLPKMSMDHSLQTDLRMLSSSPNSLSIYDSDVPSQTLCGLSPMCGTDAFNSISEFDMKFESSEDLMKLDLTSLDLPFEGEGRGDQSWSPYEKIKFDNIFDKDDNEDGPTFAALNFPNVISNFDEMENMENMVLNPERGHVMWGQGVHNLTHPLEQSVGNNPNIQKGSRRTSSTVVLPVCSTSEIWNTSMALCTNNTQSICNKRIQPITINTTVEATPITQVKIEPQSPKEIKTEILKVFNTLPHVLETQVKVSSSVAKQDSTPSPVKIQMKSKVGAISQRSSLRSSPCLSVGSVDRKWEEIKQFIHDEPPNFVMPTETSQTMTTMTTMHPKIKTELEDTPFAVKEEVMSCDEDDMDSDLDNSDDDGMDDEILSDTESLDSLLMQDDFTPNGTKKEKRYFWQYNTQSKGPKGKRLCKSMMNSDPYNLSNFADPVFDPDLNQSRYKHSGKARKGDGNDIKPNPYRLFQLGKELRKLSRTINNFTPVSELPVNSRSKSRREKNKLASRACRLKKKAQHEANKVKLHGLNNEHENLLTVICMIKHDIQQRVDSLTHGEGVVEQRIKLVDNLDSLSKTNLKHMLAGHTTDYVNSVLVKTVNGTLSSGF